MWRKREEVEMHLNRLVALLLLVAAVCLLSSLFCQDAHAGDFGDLFKKKEGAETGAGVTTLQKALGIGSIFVMIAVMKYA